MKKLSQPIPDPDSKLTIVGPVAENARLDQHVFLLDGIQWKLLIDALDTPAQPSEALRNLLSTKAPWEKESKRELSYP